MKVGGNNNDDINENGEIDKYEGNDKMASEIFRYGKYLYWISIDRMIYWIHSSIKVDPLGIYNFWSWRINI